jgi:phage terminase small subunit
MAGKKSTKDMSTAEARKAMFVEAYIANGGNATEAAKAAGYSAKTAKQQGSRLLTNVDISASVAKRRAHLVEKMELTTERTLLEIARLAYVDPRKFFHADGTPKEITELDDDTAAALAGMEVTEEWEGTGADKKIVGVTKKYKLTDKNAALEKAMKHLGQYEKDNAQKHPIQELDAGALQRFIERKAKEAGVTVH